ASEPRDGGALPRYSVVTWPVRPVPAAIRATTIPATSTRTAGAIQRAFPRRLGEFATARALSLVPCRRGDCATARALLAVPAAYDAPAREARRARVATAEVMPTPV